MASCPRGHGPTKAARTKRCTRNLVLSGQNPTVGYPFVTLPFNTRGVSRRYWLGEVHDRTRPRFDTSYAGWCVGRHSSRGVIQDSRIENNNVPHSTHARSSSLPTDEPPRCNDPPRVRIPPQYGRLRERPNGPPLSGIGGWLSLCHQAGIWGSESSTNISPVRHRHCAGRSLPRGNCPQTPLRTSTKK